MEAKRKAERQQAMFAKLDTDGNGKISQTEFASQSGPMRGMERMDTDGDGTVTEEEREAARAMMKEHRGKWGRRGDGPPPEAPDAE
jgi:Ca2+-binding EF-hand superfamily protein